MREGGGSRTAEQRTVQGPDKHLCLAKREGTEKLALKDLRCSRFIFSRSVREAHRAPAPMECRARDASAAPPRAAQVRLSAQGSGRGQSIRVHLQTPPKSARPTCAFPRLAS